MNQPSPAPSGKRLAPCDLLIAVLANLPSQEFRIFDPSDIVNALYRVSKNPRFTEAFSACIFDEDGIDPECRDLTLGLDMLQQSAMLGRLNPYLTNYKVSDALVRLYRRSLSGAMDAGFVKDLASTVFDEIRGLVPALNNA